MVSLLFGSCFCADLAAKDRVEQSSQKKRPHNLPDIAVTEEQTWAIDQEFNVYSNSAVSNSTIDYGLASGWNFGVSFLNVEFYAWRSDAWSFQPDVLINLEKHWRLGYGSLVAGTQTGAGFLAQGTVTMSYSYLDFQQHFPDWDIDFDLGGYYANAALAGWQSVGLHVSVEIPLGNVLRLNGDYFSGSNGVAATTVKLIYPLSKDVQLGAGIQVAGAQNTGEDYAGLLALYWQ